MPASNRSTIDRRGGDRRGTFNRRAAPALTLNTMLLCAGANTTVSLNQCAICDKKCERGMQLLLLINKN